MNKKELVDLLKKGDKQAFSLLYQTYSGKMMKICLRYVSDKQIAQDLLHDGFIIILTSIKALRHPDKLESWMGMIMKNISLRYLTQGNTLNTVPLSEIEEGEEPMDVSLLELFPSYEFMLEMIEKLPDGYQKVFKLSVLEGLSHKEIGLLLGIAPHSSSSQLFRAKEMLRKLITQYYLAIIFLLLVILPFTIWLKTDRQVIEGDKVIKLTQKDAGHREVSKDSNDLSRSSRSSVHQIQYAHAVRLTDTIAYPPVSHDSITGMTEVADTTDIPDEGRIQKWKKQSYPPTRINIPSDKKERWSLAIAYSGRAEQTTTGHVTIPGDASSGASGEVKVKEKVRHCIPVTLSFALHKNINEYWGIETGLRYTYLKSNFVTLGEHPSEKIQKINYLGIPLKGTFKMWKQGRMSVYASAGLALDIPIKATSEETFVEKEDMHKNRKQTLTPPLQWSINGGVGFQYQLTSSIGIYAEPNLYYYFNQRNSLNTIRKEHPFGITLPVGIRFSW